MDSVTCWQQDRVLVTVLDDGPDHVASPGLVLADLEGLSKGIWWLKEE